MQSRKPDFVSINGRKVKIQSWQQWPNRVLFTTLVQGNTPATELLADMQRESVVVQWDDSPLRSATPEISHHRAAGAGPATVHRIEATLWLVAEPAPRDDDSIDARLDRILHELQALRAEVAELRGSPRSAGGSMAAPLASGHTMMDFEIEENG